MIGEFDNVFVLAGIVLGLLATFNRAENKCDLSLYRVLKANSWRKLLGHFVVFGACYYLLTLLIMPLLWYIPKLSQAPDGVKATVVPFFVAFAPTQVLPLVLKKITKNLVNPDGTGGFLKFVHSIYEWVLAFWTARIRDSEAYHKEELASRSGGTKTRIRMIYEFSKLRIAVLEHEHYLLRTDDLVKKCGILMRFYKYERFLRLMEAGSDEFEKMTSEFNASWKGWSGSERRGSSPPSQRTYTRISDFPHVKSAIERGFSP